VIGRRDGVGDSWTFGWTQLLTIVGMVLTSGIAFRGFRTFDQWKREKLEERRIEVAIDALALSYESKIVFRSVRSAFSSSNEYKDMPIKEGESEDDRARRGSTWVPMKRITDNGDYFERVWKLQPLVMAVFGEQMEEVFGRLHNARALVQVASRTLTFDPPPPVTPENRELANQLKADLWGEAFAEDRVERNLEEFRKGIEKLCKPVVDRELHTEGYIGDP
jgi:hypothetical protein